MESFQAFQSLSGAINLTANPQNIRNNITNNCVINRMNRFNVNTHQTQQPLIVAFVNDPFVPFQPQQCRQIPQHPQQNQLMCNNLVNIPFVVMNNINNNVNNHQKVEYQAPPQPQTQFQFQFPPQMTQNKRNNIDPDISNLVNRICSNTDNTKNYKSNGRTIHSVNNNAFAADCVNDDMLNISNITASSWSKSTVSNVSLSPSTSINNNNNMNKLPKMSTFSSNSSLSSSDSNKSQSYSTNVSISCSMSTSASYHETNNEINHAVPNTSTVIQTEKELKDTVIIDNKYRKNINQKKKTTKCKHECTFCDKRYVNFTQNSIKSFFCLLLFRKNNAQNPAQIRSKIKFKISFINSYKRKAI